MCNSEGIHHINSSGKFVCGPGAYPSQGSLLMNQEITGMCGSRGVAVKLAPVFPLPTQLNCQLIDLGVVLDWCNSHISTQPHYYTPACSAGKDRVYSIGYILSFQAQIHAGV